MHTGIIPCNTKLYGNMYVVYAPKERVCGFLFHHGKLWSVNNNASCFESLPMEKYINEYKLSNSPVPNPQATISCLPYFIMNSAPSSHGEADPPLFDSPLFGPFLGESDNSWNYSYALKIENSLNKSQQLTWTEFTYLVAFKNSQISQLQNQLAVLQRTVAAAK